MKTWRIISILVLWLCLSAQTSNYDYADTVDEAFDKSILLISANEHACYRFDVYLAVTSEQRRRGLMFVQNLPKFTGMLFIYPTSRILSIWMKNTYIPLDIVFFDTAGQIVNIHKNAEPHTLISRRSAAEVNYVLELNGGTAEELSIDTSSRVLLLD
tara:strand:+ start:1592 stop:2062 length:471 start_codon:yes stop_codon:yes gene_type:complete